MYLKSGTDYYMVPLEGIDVICKSGLIIRSPNIKFKLLSYPDLNKIDLMFSSGMRESDINEEICNKCIECILGFEDEVLNYEETPAGVFDHIGTKIRLNSLTIIDNIEETYQKYLTVLSIYERLALVVSHYTATPYDLVKEYPIDELFKRYTLCSLAFPNTVPAIELQEEKVSKVG